MGIGESMGSLLTSVVNIAVRVVIFLAIVVIGWFVATWLRKWVRIGLQRIGFDRAADRGGLSRMLGRSSASDVGALVVMLGVVLLVLHLAFGVFGPNPFSDLIRAVIAWLPMLFIAIVIVVITAAIAGWVKQAVEGALGGFSYGKWLALAAQVSVLALGIFAALGQIGIGTAVTGPLLITALATIGGVIVVGVGGGMIRPMQSRMERFLSRAEVETSTGAAQNRMMRSRQAMSQEQGDRFSQPAYQSTSPSASADEKAQPADQPGRRQVPVTGSTPPAGGSEGQSQYPSSYRQPPE